MSSLAIAGASGFVGSALLRELSAETASAQRLIALSREKKASRYQRIEWRSCDLYSLLQTEQALQGVDTAVYLVHSMLPSARLAQGSFEDFDYLAADNFARAAAHCGVKRIVYVGGIVPEGIELSPHLRSRLEVERALGRYGAEVIALRCGLIVGAEGSSINVVTRLVRRLPIMLCPRWTGTKSAPIAVQDVIRAIKLVLAQPRGSSRYYDLGGPEVLSYRDMMRIAADELGVRRILIPLPFLSPKLSRLWVTMVTGAPKNLLKPLVESLRTDMVPSGGRELPEFIPQRSFREALEAMRTADSREAKQPLAFKTERSFTRAKSVRSVQRMRAPACYSAKELSTIYFDWLRTWGHPWLRVRSESAQHALFLPMLRKPMLVFEFAESRSTGDRALLYIRGGYLWKGAANARLEFRKADAEVLLVAIHNYVPSVPWFMYVWTQALIHLAVMRAFARHLKLDR